MVFFLYEVCVIGKRVHDCARMTHLFHLIYRYTRTFNRIKAPLYFYTSKL